MRSSQNHFDDAFRKRVCFCDLAEDFGLTLEPFRVGFLDWELGELKCWGLDSNRPIRTNREMHE